ncbi:MAG TPA: maltose alpha-D-glucosyltransferase [Burkholderiales bacterium]
MNSPAVNAPAPSTTTTGDPHWYKDAVIYQLHIKAFFDSNGDGLGDFKGLTSKLDYVKDLGVNTLWLLPFYPSPLRDDGYDVADYHNVHPQYGTRADFRNFVREAHRRDLRVITELVVNHTSDAHPWFQAARRAPPGSSKRDFYVWSDSDDRYQGTRIIFTDTEKSNWTWDPVAKAYFWHRFFSHQPDLNFDNPKVLKAVVRSMRFWLDMGVDGFRLDAIPYLVEREGTNNENLPETHAVIREIRALLDAKHSGKVLLAEANQWPEDVREYFGNGDECHMAYHFPLMPRIYMAIAQEERYPIVEIMQQTPAIPEACQWAIFLRNHDELTLEMVTHKERDYMYRMYAADKRARINLGIRRRLAPLMENDVDRIKLMNSLLLSMPGSPIVYYGDEIGMGDNIFLGDRDGVRTPMQWSPDRNAGFSKADPQSLYLPAIQDPVYGYQAVNVEAQSRDPGSLLNWMRRMLAVRNTTRAFGRGTLEFLRAGNRKVLAYLRAFEGEAILCVANLGRSAQPVELDLKQFRGRIPVEMVGRTAFPPVGELPYLLTLPAHGFYWFRLALGSEVDVPRWHEEVLAREDLPVMVLFDGWTSFFRDRVVPWRIALAEKTRLQLETEVLPGHFQPQRWYAGKDATVTRAAIAAHAIWTDAKSKHSWMLGLYDVHGAPGTAPERYFVPLALAWEHGDEERMKALGPAAVAKVRQQANVGVLADALADEPFCRRLLAAVRDGVDLPAAGGRFEFRPTQALAGLLDKVDIDTLPVARAPAQGTNTAVTLGSRLFLKAYRRVQIGANPEPEIGRFLTEVAKFPNCVPLAGTLEFVPAHGAPSALALLQAYVPNQGDGWTHLVGRLERFLTDCLRGEAPPEGGHGASAELVRTLGRRTAELHAALALRSGDPAFDPEPVTDADRAAWRKRVHDEAIESFAMLERHRSQLAGPAHEEARVLLARSSDVLARIAAAGAGGGAALRTRIHGDYHLGQVLLARNDFLIIDFEGEPGRTLAQRRAKQCPLRDVAGMLRSFSYGRGSALQQAVQRPEDAARLEPLAADWEREMRAAFLEAYAEAVAPAPVYTAFADARGLLELFELEKALYELRYELRNRPGWVRIPLTGVLALTHHANDGD